MVMGFVQIIKLRADRYAEMEAAHEEWLRDTTGRRTVTREMILQNRAVPGEYWIVVEFPDHDAAQVNNDLPETARIAERLASLAGDAPEFVDLDVIRID
jgi:hypothetical protein